MIFTNNQKVKIIKNGDIGTYIDRMDSMCMIMVYGARIWISEDEIEPLEFTEEDNKSS